MLHALTCGSASSHRSKWDKALKSISLYATLSSSQHYCLPFSNRIWDNPRMCMQICMRNVFMWSINRTCIVLSFVFFFIPIELQTKKKNNGRTMHIADVRRFLQKRFEYLMWSAATDIVSIEKLEKWLQSGVEIDGNAGSQSWTVWLAVNRLSG